MLTKEQLTNKYIKYNSLITEEIFDKIINKLVEYFGKSNRGMSNKYNDFKNIYNYIQIFNNYNNFNWSLDNNTQSNEEIQVSDILGNDYDIGKLQFEIGKWYKFTGAGEYISRFKTIRNNSFITDTGYIYDGKYSIDTINGAIINIDREFTEVPIEEIQQYLPNGHPDKLPKFLTVDDLVGGEVYTDEDCIFIAPNVSTKGLRISTKSIAKNNQFSLNNSELRLATPEEKQWLNVCISEGKFVEKDYALRGYDMYGKPLKSEVDEKEMKEEFEIGDWIVLLKDYCSLKKGDIYQIVKFQSDNKYYAVVNHRKDPYIAPSIKNMRKATPEEIAKVTKLIDKPFEFDKWYKPDNADGLFFIKSKNTGHGFRSNHVNCWFVRTPDMGDWDLNNLIPAEDSEIKERLLNYAKEKYPIGTIFNSTGGYVNCIITKESSYIIESDGDIKIRNNDNLIGRVFSKNLSRWAEIISTPETKESKEMRLSDLKNPVFNIGDKVRVIADSLKEFNSSWINGINADYKKGYEGLITKIDRIKSCFEEINTWCYLNNNSNGISCNLLELVEPVKKEFDKNWYVEVNSQEEADILKELEMFISNL